MGKEEMIQLLTTIAEATARTFGRNCETLIQDLSIASHPILAIFNGQVTGREVGSTEDVFGEVSRSIDSKLMQRNMINMMVNRGRQKIKSTTVVVRGEDYCLGLGINLDVTAAHDFAEVLTNQLDIDNYLGTAIDTAKEIRLQETFEACLAELGVPVERMRKEDRVELVRGLKRQHAFDYQKAVPYVSKRLGVSRYTIYNYLKELE